MGSRYSRQSLFAPIGEQGQQKLTNKHVLIIGLGALGTGSSEALARAGVGQLTLIDRDYVEWSNLQRQQLYTEADAEERIPKAIAAKKRLQAINSEIEIKEHILDATPLELENLIGTVDLILDATDNFEIRMIINDLSQKHRIPWIYGSCVGSYGISYTVLPGKTPCLHCLMEDVPMGGLTCDTAGIIQPTVGMVVVQQTAEALKLLTDNESALRNKLLSFDLWTNEQSSIHVEQLKKLDCPSCGKEPTYPFLAFENQTKTAVLCGRDTVQIRPAYVQNIDLEAIAIRLLETGGQVERNPFLLSFAIHNERLVLFQDGRSLVHGTNDKSKARTLYHQYFGS